MIELKPLANYTASEITEATSYSPALKSYLSSSYSADQQFHQKRNQAWIEAGLATILNSHSAFEVCTSWSQTASHLLRDCFERCFSGIPAALFALGKLGSQELNLSSDVDLLILSEEDQGKSQKALRQFQKILSERTSRGFVFRVDFDLRPGGRSGPLIPTVDQLIDYYGNYGETWERLAFVRLAHIAGDPELISQATTFAGKFTYRRHLDYTLLDDLKNLRGKIRQQATGRNAEGWWDLKLGVGAIRDVELFVHALQVIHGGKNPQLQVCGTGHALDLLKENKILQAQDCDFLKEHYWNLRHLENLVQAKDDEQTHFLEKNAILPLWTSGILKKIEDDFSRCDQIVSTLLGVASPATNKPAEMSPAIEIIWEEILAMEVLSRNKERDEQARLRFLNDFYDILQKQKGDTAKALHHLKEFIKSTRAKASFFTLLVRNKNLLEELAWLFGHSPYLSQILSSRPELIDSYVYRSQDLEKGDLSLLLEQLVEKRLLGELVSGSHYLEDRNVEVLQSKLSDTADEICKTLLEELKNEFTSDLEVLTLGKWGGRELGFRSDLDFILVTFEEPTEGDTKLARRFINRLTELRKGGNIYAIDMRLKPSGKGGPIVISYSHLQEYFSKGAQAWEKQAYLKARWLTKDLPPVSDLVLSKKLSDKELPELEEIRQNLIRQVPAGWDLKYMEGGLLDIELFAQTYLLINSIRPQSTNTLDFLLQIPAAEPLRSNYLELRQIEQMLQLISTEGGAKVHVNHESFQHLAMAFQLSAKDLETKLGFIISENLQLLNQLDPRRGTKILDSGS